MDTFVMENGNCMFFNALIFSNTATPITKDIPFAVFQYEVAYLGDF